MKLVKSVLVAMLLGIMAIQMAWAYVDEYGVDYDLVDTAYKGDLKAVKYYIRKGANVNATVKFAYRYGAKTTPLMAVVGNSSILKSHKKEIIEYLISKGADVNVSANGDTALHLAITSREKEVVELLIDRGADVNAGEDSYSRNALHIALDEGMTKMVKLLVDNGADVNAEANSHNRTYGGHFKDITPFRTAVIRNNIEITKYLVDKSADVNARSSDGLTPLLFVLYCCSGKSDSLELVKYLVDNGADVNVRDADGNTALMYAVANDSAELVKYLVSKGADVNAKNNEGRSVVDIVDTVDRNDAIFKFLLNSGAKCDDCDE